jgi:hypothetical protein
MRYLSNYVLATAVALCSTAGVGVAQNYPSQEQFGKNRVQYQRFEWKILKSNNFEVYHYGLGTPIATLTIQYAESEFDRITEMLGYTPYNKIKIFLYNSPQELMQSNMGLATTTDLSENELNLAKSRLEIAFTGDQVGFRKKLIREITQLFVYDMLYGGSLKDALQNSLLLSLPDWYMAGVSAYVAEGWTPALDDYMRDAVVRRQLKKPSLLTGEEATIVGQSIWNYIAERYGKDNVSNILSLTRIIRTEQTSIASTLGVSYSRFLRDWRDFYTNMAATVNTSYKDATGNWQQSLGVNLNNDAAKVRISPDNQYVVATSRQGEQYSVDIIKTENGSRSTLLKGNFLVEKRNYVAHTPLVAWHRNNGLAVITDQKDEILLQIFDINEKGKAKLRLKRVIRGVNQVVDFDISNDGSSLALSAERDGKNDLYLFNVGRGSLLQLTNDLYDDLSPHFSGTSSTRVMFTSNRVRDSLSVTDKGTYKSLKDKLALFIHDGNPRASMVRRVIDSLGIISNIRSTDENTFYFLSDYKGISNLYRYEADTKNLMPLTAFNQGVKDYDYLPSAGSFAAVNGYGGKEILNYYRQLGTLANEVAATPRAQSIAGVQVYKTEQRNNPAADASMIAQMANPRRFQLDSGEVDTDNYEFDADMLKNFETRQKRINAGISMANVTSKNRKRENITIKGPVNYKGLFISNDATSDWRIDPVRGFGFAQSINMNDLLENHIIRAGFFIVPSFRTNDLWAEYSNLAHRIDYTARVDRRSLFVSSSNQKYRYNRIALTASYPFSNRARVAVTPFYAQTRLLDVNTISAPDQTSNYLGARAEYVFDNTKMNGMNMMEGTRFKLRYDLFGGVAGTSGFNRLVVDLRHYQKVHRDIILATRVSLSNSGGAAPKQSVLGGMENWVSNTQEENRSENPLAVGYNNQQALIDNRDVFFVELAPLRGFNFNKISGASHLTASAELRMPLVKYFYRGPITSNFLRNFQLVTFTDIGTAWTGKGPFNRQNSLNTTVIRSDFWTATVNNFRNPFLLGYGVGARTMLFGFYVKFDYAWGLDNGEVNSAIPYLTLGYDF